MVFPNGLESLRTLYSCSWLAELANWPAATPAVPLRAQVPLCKRWGHSIYLEKSWEDDSRQHMGGLGAPPDTQ